MAPLSSIERIGRRRFLLRFGTAVAAVTVTGASLNTLLGCRPAPPPAAGPGEGTRWSAQNTLPNAADPVRPVPGTRPELTALEDHYEMYNTVVPTVEDMAGWRLRIGGLVEQPLEWTMDDLTRHEPTHLFVTLACISNPLGGPLMSTTRWTGASLQRLLPLWNLRPEATHLKLFGADDFYEVVALDTIRNDSRVMLTYAWDGVPLPIRHGYPLRIYVPSRYGMKQPKWIVSIEALDHWEPGFSVAKTWDKDAIMETTSVIDAVVLGDEDSTGTRPVLVGGVAHAGDRGISKVEVQVDGGDWQPARLRAPLSDLTWVIWRYAWPFQPGEHTFAVRAYDGTGALQDTALSSPYPDGATGIHQRKATL